ncbi:PqqD family protein [Streptomyces brevispora]|uniref:PqqD family protein n=1 Tax=Streptomyces castrisilvae TaxID=3033811 RepID=A0ABY9HE84_9ACTN|nr:PqqD family protein [Streptomyces sp. Mut1]WLQ32820.1 PqqD family protein [Streptomyces sp. Mut1]
MSDTQQNVHASVPTRRLDARVRNVRGQMMIAGPTQAFELSETAAFIWKQIDGSNTVAQIGRLLAAEYEVDEQTAVEDTAEVIVELAASSVITLA